MHPNDEKKILFNLVKIVRIISKPLKYVQKLISLILFQVPWWIYYFWDWILNIEWIRISNKIMAVLRLISKRSEVVEENEYVQNIQNRIQNRMHNYKHFVFEWRYQIISFYYYFSPVSYYTRIKRFTYLAVNGNELNWYFFLLSRILFYNDRFVYPSIYWLISEHFTDPFVYSHKLNYNSHKIKNHFFFGLICICCSVAFLNVFWI